MSPTAKRQKPNPTSTSASTSPIIPPFFPVNITRVSDPPIHLESVCWSDSIYAVCATNPTSPITSIVPNISSASTASATLDISHYLN